MERKVVVKQTGATLLSQHLMISFQTAQTPEMHARSSQSLKAVDHQFIGAKPICLCLDALICHFQGYCQL